MISCQTVVYRCCTWREWESIVVPTAFIEWKKNWVSTRNTTKIVRYEHDQEIPFLPGIKILSDRNGIFILRDSTHGFHSSFRTTHTTQRVNHLTHTTQLCLCTAVLAARSNTFIISHDTYYAACLYPCTFLQPHDVLTTASDAMPGP